MSTFRKFLKENFDAFGEYNDKVLSSCLKIDNEKYQDINSYYKNEIKEAFDNDIPVNKIAAEICARFDDEFNNDIDDNNDSINADADIDDVVEISESTDDGVSDGESYEEWKLNVFKYIDKRIDINKVKELGNYVKDFIKQEFDNGEPSWFMAAESIVNYVRIKYPDCLKDRSFATNITESELNEEKKVKGIIGFRSEDAAYDAMSAWRDLKERIVGSMLPGFYKDNCFLTSCEQNLKDVEAYKDGYSIIVTGKSKQEITDALEWFSEIDEDMVSYHHLIKENLFTDAYTTYKEKVFKILKKICSIEEIQTTRKIESYIRDFFVDKMSAVDCAMTIKENGLC